MTINKAKINPVPTLEQAFDFTPDDLAENREGRLSLRQRKSLTHMGLIMLGCWTAIIFGVFVILVATLYNYDSTVQLTSLLFLSVLFLLPMIVQRIHVLTFPRDVRSVTGSIFLNLKNSGYIAVIDDQWFNLNEVQYRSLRQERCTIYYSPRGKRIVSVEWLGEW